MAQSRRKSPNGKSRTIAKRAPPILENGKVASRQASRSVKERRSRATPHSPLPPRRLTNAARRSREYLTHDEVNKVLTAAGKVGRHGPRDRTLLLIAYRHALRVSELVSLRWDQVDLKGGLLHVTRLKNGVSSSQPIRGPELRSLREL